MDDTYHALRENITQQDQELLLRAQDLEIELREETSLASFIAGFRLGMGIAGGDRALLFRGRGGKAGHREGKNEVPPVQKLIRYTKKKGCQAAVLS